MAGAIVSRLDDGYTVVIVGAAGGIGSAAAAQLAGRGATVALVDRDLGELDRIVSAASADASRMIPVAADATDEESFRAAVDQVLSATGRVDAVVNAVGTQGPLGRPSHDVEVGEFEAVLRVNLTSALVITRVVIPHLIERGYGRIAHVASVAGKEGNPNMVAYSASKAGLIGMVKSQGKEYATSGVTVNAIAPAAIDTPFLAAQPRETVQYMAKRIPMERLGTTLEVAEMIGFMVSPACSFTTGSVFDLSGGRATY